MAVTIDGVGTVNGVTLPTTGFGKVLQVVRATDTTQRNTTSTSYVDVTGMAVTITPTSATSDVILLVHLLHDANGGVNDNYTEFVITDSANNILAGSYAWQGTQNYGTGVSRSALSKFTTLTTVSPATTSAVTYKLRMRSPSASTTAYIYNNIATGQMYAIEVSA